MRTVLQRSFNQITPVAIPATSGYLPEGWVNGKDYPSPQAAADTGKNVYYPPGRFKLYQPVSLYGNGDFIGAGMQQTIFEPQGADFPAFINATGQISSGKNIGGFQIDYGPATGNTKATNVNARGIEIINRGGVYFPSMFSISNLIIYNAYYGMYLEGNAWAGQIDHIYAGSCEVAFYGKYLTNIEFNKVASEYCTYGYDMNSLAACVFRNIGMTQATGTTRQLGHANFYGCQGLLIEGFDIEGCIQESAYRDLLNFQRCHAVKAHGLAIWSNILKATAGEEVHLVQVCDGTEADISMTSWNNTHEGDGSFMSFVVGVPVLGLKDRVDLSHSYLGTISGTGGYVYSVTAGADRDYFNADSSYLADPVGSWLLP